MTSVDAALAAMDTAEQEARELLEAATELAALLPDMATVAGWARDRLRLIQRDRETLQRHRLRVWADGGGTTCGECVGVNDWPCIDALAVINHWTENA